MSRISRVLFLLVLLVSVLACNAIARPINQAQDVVETAQSFATALPVETLQSLATSMPVETIEAMASEIPDLENFNYFDPQGTPVTEWKEIPIMPQATVGQEFADTNTYSFKADVTPQEVKEFYDGKLTDLGWNSVFSLPVADDGGILSYSKDSSILTVTITKVEGVTVIVLSMA